MIYPISGKVVSFWKGNNSRVGFRLYGYKMPFLVSDGVSEEMTDRLCVNLPVLCNVANYNTFWLVDWLSMPLVVLRGVKWEERRIEFFQTRIVPRRAINKRRVFIESDLTEGLEPHWFSRGSKRILDVE